MPHGVDLNICVGMVKQPRPRRWIKNSSLAKRALDACDVLVASSGVGPVGRSLWMCPALHHVYPVPVTYSNFCKRFRCKSPLTAVYVDRILLDIRESGRIWEYASGTSIPDLDHKGLLSSLTIVIPTDSVLSVFHDFCEPIAQMLYSLESRTLAELRDTLLPKLMSGRRPRAGQRAKSSWMPIMRALD